VVETWFLETHFAVSKNTPLFRDLFSGWILEKQKATTKAKAIILSLRPSGFASAFGRAVAHFGAILSWCLKPHA
jgi:hypothetical protein